MIYVIDDEPMIREVLSSFIEYLGFENISFPSGNHFLEHIAKDNTIIPHMVFSDIRMPGITGLQMIERFKSIHPDIPCCIVTAYDDMLTHDHPIHDTLHRIISKPFMLEDIQEALAILQES